MLVTFLVGGIFFLALVCWALFPKRATVPRNVEARWKRAARLLEPEYENQKGKPTMSGRNQTSRSRSTLSSACIAGDRPCSPECSSIRRGGSRMG